MKILVCAEEDIMMTAIEFRLQKHGFQLLAAKTGKEAIQVFLESPPHLVVTDLGASVENGLSVTRYIREIQKSEIPIILVGDLEDELSILDSIHDGANDFIIRPFKPAELIIRIKRLLREITV